MKISEQFAGSYFKAQDLPQPRVLTIQDCTQAKMPEGETKPALRFVGESQQLILNKTNAFCLAEWFGDDTNGWNGRQIELHATTTSFGGRMVPAIRVRLPQQQYQQPVQQRPYQPAPVPMQPQYQQPVAQPAPQRPAVPQPAPQPAQQPVPQWQVPAPPQPAPGGDFFDGPIDA
jgi:hypothetical protein